MVIHSLSSPGRTSDAESLMEMSWVFVLIDQCCDFAVSQSVLFIWPIAAVLYNVGGCIPNHCTVLFSENDYTLYSEIQDSYNASWNAVSNQWSQKSGAVKNNVIVSLLFYVFATDARLVATTATTLQWCQVQVLVGWAEDMRPLMSLKSWGLV